MNPWDNLSDCFNTHKDANKITPSAADNILIAWPAIFEGIGKVQSSGKGLTAFDFGCGTGSFAQALYHRGYEVEACDTSEEMIRIAKAHIGENVTFHSGSAEIASKLKGAPFSLISSIMVLQFVPNIEEILSDLDKVLRPEGLIAFAVFNPDYIRANTSKNGFFQTAENSSEEAIFMVTKDAKIPLYPRTEKDYKTLLKKYGYKRILYKRPRFTRAFLNKYPKTTDTRFSEYLIMVYKKPNNSAE